MKNTTQHRILLVLESVFIVHLALLRWLPEWSASSLATGLDWLVGVEVLCNVYAAYLLASAAFGVEAKSIDDVVRADELTADYFFSRGAVWFGYLREVLICLLLVVRPSPFWSAVGVANLLLITLALCLLVKLARNNGGAYV